MAVDLAFKQAAFRQNEMAVNLAFKQPASQAERNGL
jgi:hypothetical protein